MTFATSYTTQRLITADAVAKPEEKTGEDKKIAISEETYLTAKLMEELIKKIGLLR